MSIYGTCSHIHKLCACFQDLAHGLQELLDYEGSVEDDFGLTFQVSDAAFKHLARILFDDCCLT